MAKDLELEERIELLEEVKKKIIKKVEAKNKEWIQRGKPKTQYEQAFNDVYSQVVTMIDNTVKKEKEAYA